MEENKNLGEVKTEEPTTEQLKYWLNKAISDNKQLIMKYQEVTDALNVLPYLFKVIEFEKHFNTTFVKKCISSIEAILVPKEEITEEEKEEVSNTKD